MRYEILSWANISLNSLVGQSTSMVQTVLTTVRQIAMKLYIRGIQRMNLKDERMDCYEI